MSAGDSASHVGGDFVSEPAPTKPISLAWEHNGLLTSGFVVERTMDFDGFAIVGYVPVSSPWTTNAEDFTFRFLLINEPPGNANYRVGAVPSSP